MGNRNVRLSRRRFNTYSACSCNYCYTVQGYSGQKSPVTKSFLYPGKLRKSQKSHPNYHAIVWVSVSYCQLVISYCQYLTKTKPKIMQTNSNIFKIIGMFFIIISLAATTIAQDLRRGEFGIRYMPTFSSLKLKTSNDDVINGSVYLSHGFGIMLGVNLSKHFGIQGEVNYYDVTQSFRDQDMTNEVEIRYLNIPLLLSLNTNKENRVNLNVVAGPQFGLNVGANVKSTGTGNIDNVDAVVAVKKGDVGFAYGAGLEFALNSNHSIRLDLGYRGFYGLVDIDADKTGDNTYNVIAKASRKTNAVYVGLTFLF